MSLRFLLLFLISSLSLHAFAQIRQNVYYLKNDQSRVSTKDSADFIRIVREPDLGTVFYNVMEYYLNGNPKLIGKFSRIEFLILQGQSISYHKSGKKQIVATYKDGKMTGAVYEYYPNGKLYTIKEYPLVYNEKVDVINDNYYKIQACFDSTGKALITDGNGCYIGYKSNYKDIYEQGNIKNGLRDGLWTGTSNDKPPVTFKEQYADGKLTQGSATDSNNKTTSYLNRGVNPKFEGGDIAFNRFLSTTIRYPSRAKESNIQGRVFISFVVEKDGHLTDFKILVNPNNDLSQEALQVLQQSPKWVPGTQFGRPVRVQYTVPVNFSLSY